MWTLSRLGERATDVLYLVSLPFGLFWYPRFLVLLSRARIDYTITPSINYGRVRPLSRCEIAQARLESGARSLSPRSLTSCALLVHRQPAMGLLSRIKTAAQQQSDNLRNSASTSSTTPDAGPSEPVSTSSPFVVAKGGDLYLRGQRFRFAR